MKPTFEEFAALVRRLRRAQKLFFRTKSPSHLGEAKALEQDVDRALDALAEGPGLFDPPSDREGG